MSTLTLRLPDEKHERIRQLARHQNVSLNRLFDELVTIALTEFDALTRFRARAAAGSREEGLRLLDKLDAAERSKKEIEDGQSSIAP